MDNPLDEIEACALYFRNYFHADTGRGEEGWLRANRILKAVEALREDVADEGSRAT